MKTSSTTNNGTLSLIRTARKVAAAGIIDTFGNFMTATIPSHASPRISADYGNLRLWANCATPG